MYYQWVVKYGYTVPEQEETLEQNPIGIYLYLLTNRQSILLTKIITAILLS